VTFRNRKSTSKNVLETLACNISVRFMDDRNCVSQTDVR
jgi:hypothetical protein